MIIILGYCFLGLGALFMLTAGVGLLRMPDFYSRLHPAGVADSLGAPLMIIGIACLGAETLSPFKLGMLVIFLLITGPTACHALAKAAFSTQLVPWKKTNSPPNETAQESRADTILVEGQPHADD